MILKEPAESLKKIRQSLGRSCRSETSFLLISYEGNEVDSSWCTWEGGSNLQRQLVEPTECQNTRHGNSDKKSVSVAAYLSVVAERNIIKIIQVRLETFELYQDSQLRTGQFCLSYGWLYPVTQQGAKVHRRRFTLSSGTRIQLPPTRPTCDKELVGREFLRLCQLHRVSLQAFLILMH